MCFGCTRQVRDRLVELKRSQHQPDCAALLAWFSTRIRPYDRLARQEGRSAWTTRKKLRYAVDSVFNFTDLPIKALLLLGIVGTLAAVLGGATVFAAWAMGKIPVLGYTPLMLVISFFGGLTALGLGIVGQYLWLSLQNARGRPAFVVKSMWNSDSHPAAGDRERHALAAPPLADRNSS
jgi:hypothetical protein